MEYRTNESLELGTYIINKYKLGDYEKYRGCGDTHIIQHISFLSLHIRQPPILTVAFCLSHCLSLQPFTGLQTAG
jgi:hypothetical protein